MRTGAQLSSVLVSEHVGGLVRALRMSPGMDTNRRVGLYVATAGTAAAVVAVGAVWATLGSAPAAAKPIPKAVVLQSMHNDNLAMSDAYGAVDTWLKQSWCAPLSKFTVYTPAQWQAVAGPGPKTPSPLAAAYSAAAITPATNSSFTLVPGYCDFYVHTPVVVTTTGKTAQNPFPVAATKRPTITQAIAATESRLPVAVGPIRYTVSQVTLEVSYAISESGHLVYHHRLYTLSVRLGPNQKAVTPASLVGGGEWQSSKPSYSPSYVVPGPDGGTQLAPPPKEVRL